MVTFFILAKKADRRLAVLARFFKKLIRNKTNLMKSYTETQINYCLLIYVFHGSNCNNTVIYLKGEFDKVTPTVFTIEVQPWELGKKCNSNFILIAIAKVRYVGITTAKIFAKNLLFLVVYQRCNDAL